VRYGTDLEEDGNYLLSGFRSLLAEVAPC